MLLTHQDQEASPNRPIAAHGYRKPDRALVIALLEHRMIELPANSLRKQVLERMIERTSEG